MNKILPFGLFFCVLFSTPLFAQKAKQAKGQDGMIRSYQLALQNGDGAAARSMVYALLAAGADSLAWQDSLTHLYFADGNHFQCVLSGRRVLTSLPSNQGVRELVAASEYALAKYKESLADYELLFKSSSSVFHAYQIAINQYMLQRLGECETTIQFLLADQTANKQTVLIGIGEGRAQEVPLQAAAWNLRGVLCRDLAKVTEAGQCFQEALKIFPDFVIAQSNLESMKRQEAKPAPEPKK
jgi:tetratricopeptide (TPR) repeat protein